MRAIIDRDHNHYIYEESKRARGAISSNARTKLAEIIEYSTFKVHPVETLRHARPDLRSKDPSLYRGVYMPTVRQVRTMLNALAENRFGPPGAKNY